MEKATFIDPADLANLKVNEDGTIQIPENIEIYIKPSVEELIESLEEELQSLTLEEPNEVELIEYGRMFHPYFEEEGMKINILNQIEELKNGS